MYDSWMTYRALTLSALAAAAAALSLPATAQDGEAKEEKKTETRGETELAEMLEGYEAGEPVNCLRRTQRDRLRVIDDTAFVFRDRQTLYVNRTNAPRFIDDFDVPVFKPFGSNLCRLDQVTFVDRAGGIPGPTISLAEFIPYTKVETES